MSESERAQEMVRALGAMTELLEGGIVSVPVERREMVRRTARALTLTDALEPAKRGLWLALAVHLGEEDE